MFCTVSFADTGCGDGYVGIEHAIANTIMMPMDGMCDGGYVLKDVPYGVFPANGSSVGSGVQLCDGYWSGTTCNPRSIADCEYGQYGIYYTNVVMAPMDGKCDGGFVIKNVDGITSANGFTAGSGITLNTITHTQGDCPNEYYDLAVNDNTFFKLNQSGTCTNGVSYTSEQCRASMPDAPGICAILCSNGLEYTDVGTCAELCPGEHHTLKTSTGLSFPLYATKQVTPSINIQMGENVCYVNLINGRASNAINVQYNNKIYHTVK